MSKATIYRRWPSREGLIIDAWRSINVRSKEPPDTGHLRTDLYALCDEYATSFDGSLLNQLPQMIAAVNQSPALGEMFARFVDEQMQPLYTIYERARDRGQMRADVDVHLAPTLLAGSIFFSLLFRGVLLSPEDLRRNTDYILEGLLVDDT